MSMYTKMSRGGGGGWGGLQTIKNFFPHENAIQVFECGGGGGGGG